MNDPGDTRWNTPTTAGWPATARGSKQGRRERQCGPFERESDRHVIDKLVEQPYTRQAQMITWMPSVDRNRYDPPVFNRSGTHSRDDDGPGG